MNKSGFLFFLGSKLDFISVKHHGSGVQLVFNFLFKLGSGGRLSGNPYVRPGT